MRYGFAAAALFLASPVLAQSGGDMTPTTVDIVESTSAAGKFEKLLGAVNSAGITETLAQAKNVTLFAPIDAAFTGAGKLPSDKGQLGKLLQYHVVPTTYLSKDIPQGDTRVKTLAGQDLIVRNRGGSISLITPSGVEAMVVQADIKSDAGVIHGISRVLKP